MEIYLLDDLYRRVTVVDRFESLIWTERYAAYGDFELQVHSTPENRTLFPLGQRLTIERSKRVMTVETIEDTVDDEGRMTLTFKGYSLEMILTRRLALAALTDLVTDPKWIITGLPAAIAAQIFHDICVTGTLDAGDIIAGVNESSIFPPDTIPAPSDSITYEADPQTVYSAIKYLCDVYNMGFRLVRNPANNQLYFDIYMGSDRTTQQTDLAAVVFSPELANLKNTKELTTVSLYKNVAYVISPVGSEIVYAQDVDPSVAGFQRSILLVRADDIEDVVPADATERMVQRGVEALAQNRQLSAFDGELVPNGSYVYDTTTGYYLGDLVELQSGSGSSSVMRVTEQIFISDTNGDRDYPTLTINRFITPGSWDDYDPSTEWDEEDPDLDWDDL
jgi:hypothetical protein